MRKRLVCLVVFLLAAVAEEEAVPPSCDHEALPIAWRRGPRAQSARLIGLFDVHEGNRCHLLRPGGMEQVMMAIAVLENRLMRNPSQIGVAVYDTCSSAPASLRHLLCGLMDAKALCPLPFCVAGVLGPKNGALQRHLSSFLKPLGIPFVPLAPTSLKQEIQALVSVLEDLKWKMVAVFASAGSLLTEFREQADQHNICIASAVAMDHRSEAFLGMKFQEITAFGVQVAVILGSGIDFREMYEMVLTTNSSVQHWLMSGVDIEDDVLFSPVILFRKLTASLPLFDANVQETYEFADNIKRLNLVQSYIEYMNSCRKEPVLNDSRCSDQLRHSSLQRDMFEESVDQLMKAMADAEEFKIEESNETYAQDPNDGRIEIWTYQQPAGPLANSKQILVGHYSNGHLNWDKKILNIFHAMGSGWFKIPEYHCPLNCRAMCENFANISVAADLDSLFTRIYHWKHETWVNILLTISCVGILITLLTALFLVVSCCREDFDEGSQVANVIVLFSVMFSYTCTLLFMFNKDSVTCHRRLAVVGVAYISMFAPIISRCFLLIAAEMDGIHAHVSGFLQIVICFFIAAVQVAMATYYWIESSAQFKCLFEVKPTLGYLSYSMLLSFVWLIASPFCARSRRNNGEGLLLHLGSIAVCLIWLVWYLLYFLLQTRWNEFTVCFGLVATATAILVVIFLPKVYKIVVARAAKQHGQVSMQPVIFASTSSRSPNLSIYESVNHGFNPDKDGFVVDVFRDEEDSPRPRKMTHL